MVTASLPFVSCFVRRVSLARGRGQRAEGESMLESEPVLRKEPSRGCLTTMEAMARALRVLEPDEGRGADVERMLFVGSRGNGECIESAPGREDCETKASAFEEGPEGEDGDGGSGGAGGRWNIGCHVSTNGIRTKNLWMNDFLHHCAKEKGDINTA